MSKNYLLLPTMVLAIMLASCGNPKTSSKNVDGVEVSDTAKEMSDAAKEIPECVFTETGYGAVQLNGKLSKLPKECENLYTRMVLSTNPDTQLMTYSLYNGNELVAAAEGYGDSDQIITIRIFSDKITVKSKNGKTMKIGMKIAEAVKEFEGNCFASWTGDEERPVIHFGTSICVETVDGTLTPAKQEEMNGYENNFEDTLPIAPGDVSSSQLIKNMKLCY